MNARNRRFQCLVACLWLAPQLAYAQPSSEGDDADAGAAAPTAEAETDAAPPEGPAQTAPADTDADADADAPPTTPAPTYEQTGARATDGREDSDGREDEGGEASADADDSEDAGAPDDQSSPPDAEATPAEAEEEEEEDTSEPAAPRQESSLGTLDEPSTVSLEDTQQLAGTDLPGRLGPVRLVINERGDRIGIGFAVQLQGAVEHTLEGGGLDKQTDGGMQFRRLRTVLASSFLEGRIRSSFQLNITPAAFELIDMWLMYSPAGRASLRVGQFKVPYTRYRAQSFAALSLTDWSPTTRMFGSERQFGLELLNNAGGEQGWEYAAGVFTGVNARAAHGVGIVEVYGDEISNPSDLRAGFDRFDVHPELIGRIARNQGAIDTSTNSDVAGGPFRSSGGFSVAWDVQPKVREDLPLRLAAEWLAKLAGWHFNVVGHAAWFTKGDGMDFGTWGWLTELGYRFNRTWELAARHSRVALSDALRSDAAAHGSSSLAAAQGNRLLSDLESLSLVGTEDYERYSFAGDQSSSDELALALSAYAVGHSLKCQLESAWLTADTTAGRQNEMQHVLQLQMQF